MTGRELGYVPPCPAIDYTTDRSRTDVELQAQSGHRDGQYSISLSDCKNVLRSQTSIAIANAACIPPIATSLGDYISHIIGLSPQVKMTRVRTFGLANTLMQHLKALRNWSIVDHPGEAVGKLVASIIALKKAISKVMLGTSPCPAVRTLDHKSPESSRGITAPGMSQTVVVELSPTWTSSGYTMSGLATTTFTQWRISSRIWLHLKSPVQIWGVVLRAVSAAPEPSCAHFSRYILERQE